jgi:hypothetical protein
MAGQVHVLCPDGFRTALRPWIEYRERQGYHLRVVAPAEIAWSIRRQIEAGAAATPLTHVVLIGDTPDRHGTNHHSAVATDYVRAEVVSQYGSEPEIATDNEFVDFDRDGLPDLAIGRMPCDSAEQLSALIRKIIAYETSAAGPWRRRINLVAGTGGFGEWTDSVIERASRNIVSELIPDGYTVSMTWANWSSPYCPDPRAFTDVTIDRLNEGCLFWVYMGHGQTTRLDYVRTPVGGYPMFSARDVARVRCPEGAPIAVLLACYTGAFDLPHDCLAEELVLQPGGPVAAVCSSRTSMPWGMGSLSLGLIEEYFSGDARTLGEMILIAKRRLNEDALAPSPDYPPATGHAIPTDASSYLSASNRFRQTMRAIGENFSPTGDRLATEAHEHVHLFHLLGDPLLQITRPSLIELEVAAHPYQPDRVIVSGDAPEAGRLLLELDYARDRMPVRTPRRDEFRDDPRSLASYQRVYEQANQRTVAQSQLDVAQGKFRTELVVPPEARGRCVVKAFLVAAPDRFALGASPIRVQRR